MSGLVAIVHVDDEQAWAKAEQDLASGGVEDLCVTLTVSSLAEIWEVDARRQRIQDRLPPRALTLLVATPLAEAAFVQGYRFWAQYADRTGATARDADPFVAKLHACARLRQCNRQWMVACARRPPVPVGAGGALFAHESCIVAAPAEIEPRLLWWAAQETGIAAATLSRATQGEKNGEFLLRESCLGAAVQSAHEAPSVDAHRLYSTPSEVDMPLVRTLFSGALVLSIPCAGTRLYAVTDAGTLPPAAVPEPKSPAARPRTPSPKPPPVPKPPPPKPPAARPRTPSPKPAPAKAAPKASPPPKPAPAPKPPPSPPADLARRLSAPMLRFDPAYYLRRYASALDRADVTKPHQAWIHWARVGMVEAWYPNGEEEALQQWAVSTGQFDPAWYLQQYGAQIRVAPSQAGPPTAAHAWMHWRTTGRRSSGRFRPCRDHPT